VHSHAIDQHDEDIITTDTEDSAADDFVLTTEHDVFKEFMPEDTDPKVDVLDSVTVEGSPELRVNKKNSVREIEVCSQPLSQLNQRINRHSN
jgi:hypothetical protein